MTISDLQSDAGSVTSTYKTNSKQAKAPKVPIVDRMTDSLASNSQAHSKNNNNQKENQNKILSANSASSRIFDQRLGILFFGCLFNLLVKYFG